MDFRRTIATKRDGLANLPEELQSLAFGAARGEVPDYQLAAWLMAAYLHPLNVEETVSLTQAMANSGQKIDRTGLPHPWLDKHSTGGVGDKTSIVLLPMLAAAGIPIIKMSGPGLGITGGTVDKLSAIPGFQAALSPAELVAQAKRIGIAWSGQTALLAPADRVLYSLREATNTIDSVPLIVSSILSKKIAAGAETVLVDVKCGSGAFMVTQADASDLARALRQVGVGCGLQVQTVITDMDQPLGRSAGNSLELVEAIQVLQGAEGAVRDLCASLCAEALAMVDPSRGRSEALELLDSGRAFSKMVDWVAAQGGDARVLEDTARIELAPCQIALEAPEAGWVARVDAGAVGRAVLGLGGGRLAKGDKIDLSVGVETLVRVGDPVVRSQPLFSIHARNKESAAKVAEGLLSGVTINSQQVASRPIVMELKRSNETDRADDVPRLR